MDPHDKRFDLYSNLDLVAARQCVREMSRELGFGLSDQTRIATAVSEICRRALKNHGQIIFTLATDGTRRGIECICSGSEWKESQVSSGQTPGELVGIERLMDEFRLTSGRNGDTVIVMRKWLP